MTLEMLDKAEWRKTTWRLWCSLCDQKCHQLSHATSFIIRCGGIFLACQLQTLLLRAPCLQNIMSFTRIPSLQMCSALLWYYLHFLRVRWGQCVIVFSLLFPGEGSFATQCKCCVGAIMAITRACYFEKESPEVLCDRGWHHHFSFLHKMFLTVSHI